MATLGRKNLDRAAEKNQAISRDARPTMALNWAIVAAPVALLLASTVAVNRIVKDQYMDEIFHVKQTQVYCDGRYDEWDPKITTLPGLYVYALGAARALAALLGVQLSSSSALCSAAALRLYNAVVAIPCAWLTYALARDVMGPKVPPLRVALHAASVLLFPPFFFSASLFYTDLGSNTLVLLACWLSARGRMGGSALAGAMAIFFRQTNVIWVCFAAGISVISKYEKGLLDSRADVEKSVYVPVTASHVPPAIAHFVRCVVNRMPRLIQVYAAPILVVFGFIGFVVKNGAITVGDSSNHSVSLHVAQILYFAGTVMSFSWGWAVASMASCLLSTSESTDSTSEKSKTKDSVKVSWRQEAVYAAAGAAAMALAVRFCTIAHPFLLADNRHFTFYLWRRVLNAFGGLGKYALIPGYLFSFRIISTRLTPQISLLKQLLLWACVTAVLVPTPLLEFRYGHTYTHTRGVS